jgi:uncharacterized membrane protein YhiD involved in acid resistance
MPPWLEPSATETDAATPLELVVRFTIAFLLGCIVAAIYRGTHRSSPIAPTFPRTLVLLSILIAMVTSVIGDNIARAFSLVGALSIVRFRTVVQDTQDTAFVIFAVIIGMAAGANHLWVAAIGMSVVAVAIIVLRPRKGANVWADADNHLVLRVGLSHNPETVAQNVFQKYLDRSEVLSVATTKQGTSLEVTYNVRLKNGSIPADFVGELNRTEGIQGVDLRQHHLIE